MAAALWTVAAAFGPLIVVAALLEALCNLGDRHRRKSP